MAVHTATTIQGLVVAAAIAAVIAALLLLCSRCGQMSDDLRRIDNILLCSSCREEEFLG